MAVATVSPERQSMRHSPSLSSSKSERDDASAVSSIFSVPGIGDHQAESSIKDVEIQSATYVRSEEYRLLFHLPPEQVLVQDFNCAFQENILLQGHMYLFVHYICFYSNIFGFETKKIIPFNEVTCVRKAKTAAIFPNAIEIFAGGKKYFFASFLSRDEAYRLIVDGWSQNNTDVKDFLDNQESKSDAGAQDNVTDLSERCKSIKESTNDSYHLDRSKVASLSEECKPLLGCESDIGKSTILSEVQGNGEEENAECLSPRESLTWNVEDVDAPKIPGYYKMVAESKFPIRVEEFFSLFFSNAAVDFIKAFHTRCGDKEFRCTPWYKHEQFQNARDVSFQHPIKLFLGARFGHCQEVQKFRVYRDSHLVIKTSQQVTDVPYGDYFRVEGIWDVERDEIEQNGCNLRVYVNVVFSRKTVWKGKIEQSTTEECREAYAIWICNAKELLKQKHILAKVEGDTSNYTSSMQNVDIGLGSGESPERPSETLPDTRTPKRTFDSKKVIPLIDSQRKADASDATAIASVFRESMATFSSYLTSQSHFTTRALIIVFVAILILMHLSIIVQLTRAPKVHLISQENLMNSLGSDRSDAVAWLERRVHHLEDEMLMVEARLEKMRHEYQLLKSHLQGLEQLHLKS